MSEFDTTEFAIGRAIRTVYAIGVVTAMLIVSRAVVAQDHPVQWSGVPAAETVVAGGTVAVTLQADISAGWHVYSLTQGPGGPVPTRISLFPNQAFALSDSIKAQPPLSMADSNFGITVEMYEGRIPFLLPVRAEATAPAGPVKMLVRVRYQACNASACLPVRTDTVAVPIKVTAATHSTKKKGTSG